MTFPSMTFEEAWAEKEKEGYQYGEDALEHVHFGWEICVAAMQGQDPHPHLELTGGERMLLACIKRPKQTAEAAKKAVAVIARLTYLLTTEMRESARWKSVASNLEKAASEVGILKLKLEEEQKRNAKYHELVADLEPHDMLVHWLQDREKLNKAERDLVYMTERKQEEEKARVREEARAQELDSWYTRAMSDVAELNKSNGVTKAELTALQERVAQAEAILKNSDLATCIRRALEVLRGL